jgi:hypothetical protein
MSAPATGYPDGGFSWFSLVISGKFWDSTLKLGHDRFLPNPSHHSLVTLSSTLVTERASYNEC